MSSFLRIDERTKIIRLNIFFKIYGNILPIVDKFIFSHTVTISWKLPWYSQKPCSTNVFFRENIGILSYRTAQENIGILTYRTAQENIGVLTYRTAQENIGVLPF